MKPMAALWCSTDTGVEAKENKRCNAQVENRSSGILAHTTRRPEAQEIAVVY